MIKNFLWKNKIAISACVLTTAFAVGYWVLSSPGTTSIGENITVGSNLYVNGNVGIGTTNPGAKLDVNGLIKAKGLVLPSAKMRRANSTQAIPSGINTKINFDIEDYDIGGIADTATDRFVISQPGRYLVTASWGTTTSQNTQVQVWINGGWVGRQYISYAAGNGDTTPVFTSVYNLNAGDIIEMYVFTIPAAVTGTGCDAPQMTVTQLN